MDGPDAFARTATHDEDGEWNSTLTMMWHLPVLHRIRLSDTHISYGPGSFLPFIASVSPALRYVLAPSRSMLFCSWYVNVWFCPDRKGRTSDTGIVASYDINDALGALGYLLIFLFSLLEFMYFSQAH